MDKRPVPSSSRILELKKRRKKVLRNKLILFGSLFLVLLVGLIFLSRWQRVNISNINISGNNVIDTKVIQKIVDEELSGNYFFIFPKKNFLIYPKNAILNKLYGNFKRIDRVELSVSNTKVLNVVLTERKAVYTWCGDDIKANIDSILDNGISGQSQCYFMNETGYIFDEAPNFSGNVFLKFYGKVDRDNSSPIGQNYLPGTFPKVVFFLDNIKGIDIKPASLNVLEDGDAELYLTKKSDDLNSPKVVINLSSDLTKVAENLQAAISTEPLKKNLKEDYSNFEYIDLRFGNKIYYKFTKKDTIPTDTDTSEPVKTVN